MLIHYLRNGNYLIFGQRYTFRYFTLTRTVKYSVSVQIQPVIEYLTF